MLQFFNNKLKGIFTWIIIITISVIFLATGMDFFFINLGMSKSYIAKVGDNEISPQQFEKFSQKATTQNQKKQLLNQMISQYLVLSDSQRHNIEISKLTLQAAIFNSPIFFDESGEFSIDKLKQAASYLGGINNLEQIISENIKATIIPKTIINTSFATSYEKDIFSKLYFINKNIKYIKLTSEDLQNAIKPTLEKLQQFYHDHKNQYISPAKVDINYFIISRDDFKTKNNINEQKIKKYYNDNKQLFTKFNTKTKNTITNILENRQALEKYNFFTHDIDALKFNELEKKLGKAKKDIISNDNSDIKNSLFFIKKNTYASIAMPDNKTLIYKINKLINSTQQEFSKVKEKVAQKYIAQKSQELVDQKAKQLLTNLNRGIKINQNFHKANISNNSKDFSADFIKYIILNNNSDYHKYKTQSGDIYIYKVVKIKSKTNKQTGMPNKIIDAFEKEELNFYLQIIKNEIPIKINYKNI